MYAVRIFVANWRVGVRSVVVFYIYPNGGSLFL